MPDAENKVHKAVADIMNNSTLTSNFIAEISISYKKPQSYLEQKKILSSKDAFEAFSNLWSEQLEYREEFMILVLNRANIILGYCQISSGGTSGTIADPKMIFQAALKANSSSIILCHNHPSGNTKPSEPDKHLTQKLATAGKLLDLPILDHLIISESSFYSFADEGIMPSD